MKRVDATAWYLLFVAAAATLIGGLMTLHEEGRYAGALTLCLALSMGALGIGELTATAPPPPAIERVTLPDGSSEDALVLRYRRMRPAFRVVGSLALTPIAAAFVFGPGIPAYGRVIVGLGSVYFIGAGISAVVARVRAGRPAPSMLALSRSGVLLQGSGSVTYLAWAAVVRVARTSVGGQPMLTVTAAMNDAIVRPGARGVLDQFAGSLFVGSSRLPINASRLSVTPATLETLASRFATFARSGEPAPLPDLADVLAARSEREPAAAG